MIEIIEKDLTKLSTIHTQSKAKYFVQFNSIDDIEECVSYATKNNLQIVIIGKGTNILFTQNQYTDKLFMKLGKGFNAFNIDENFVEIGGSYSFMRAGKQLIDMGYKEFVYMSLIPGSLGGGVRQNAGTTKEGEVKDNFISAKVYNFKKNKIETFNKDEMNFSYRNSLLQELPNQYIVLSAKFLLGERTDDLKALKNFIKEKQDAKKSKEPSGFSFGSTFKSMKYPKQVWWYIDQVGLRNKSIGGAKFSQKHSNWIINDDNAKASDILQLIEEAKEKVLKAFDINLHVEVELI